MAPVALPGLTEKEFLLFSGTPDGLPKVKALRNNVGTQLLWYGETKEMSESSHTIVALSMVIQINGSHAVQVNLGEKYVKCHAQKVLLHIIHICGGVDLADQNKSYYPVGRESVKF